MKTEQIIEPIIELMDEVFNDERMYYQTATYKINAPLAFIQMAKESQLHTCQRILGLRLSRFPLTKEIVANAKAEYKAITI